MTARRAKRFLADLGRRDHAALEKTLRAAIVEWDADGWAIVGTPPRLRVAILVRRQLKRPTHSATTIALPRSLGGGELKVAVIATHRPRERAETAVLAPEAGTDFLAPGSPVLGDGERIGIAAIVEDGTAVYIITCGHPFGSPGSSLTTLDGTEIGELSTNLFDGRDGSDASLFAVNDRGLDLLADGGHTGSWCKRIHDPDATDNGQSATFWPTWSDNDPPFAAEVRAFSSCVPATSSCGAIMLDRCTSPGDSGSSLQFAGAYYGIASRRSGNYSFFTPLAEVKQRLARLGTNIIPWSPS